MNGIVLQSNGSSELGRWEPVHETVRKRTQEIICWTS